MFKTAWRIQLVDSGWASRGWARRLPRCCGPCGGARHCLAGGRARRGGFFVVGVGPVRSEWVLPECLAQSGDRRGGGVAFLLLAGACEKVGRERPAGIGVAGLLQARRVSGTLPPLR